jgi:hypothetical protein
VSNLGVFAYFLALPLATVPAVEVVVADIELVVEFGVIEAALCCC